MDIKSLKMYKYSILFLAAIWSHALFTSGLPLSQRQESVIVEEDIDSLEDLELPEDKRSIPELGRAYVGEPLRRSAISQPYPVPSEPKTERALKREDLAIGAPDTQSDDESPSEADNSDASPSDESGSGVASGSGLSEAGIKETEFAMQMRPMNRPNVPQQKGPVVEVEDPTLFQDPTIQEMNKSFNEPMMMYHQENSESGSGEQ